MQMFPKIQFIVTTHSPLFVLGMHKAFGEDGFALYRLPQGQQINPEKFSEFGDAYQSLTTTRRFSADIQAAIEKAQKPILLVEGETDREYLQRAASLLGKEDILGKFEVRDGGGSGNLVNIWRDFRAPMTDMLPQRVLLLFDCDTRRASENRGNLFQRTMPLQSGNPVQNGIENIFSKLTLERVQQDNQTFIDVADAHSVVRRGALEVVGEKWTVNEHEKARLCRWLCENGTEEDFQGFGEVFELLEECLDVEPGSAG